MSTVLFRNVSAGLGAGAAAALVAILVSLPLESPDDIRFNSATVGFTTLAIGAVNGLLWHWSMADLPVNGRYIATSLGLLIVGLAVAVGLQTQFDRAISFTVPLAIVAVLITVIATPFAAVNQGSGRWIASRRTYAALVIIAVAASLALAGQGDQESGTLTLPPPP